VILSHMSGARLLEAAKVAALIVLALIATRLVYVIGWNRLSVWSAKVRGPLPPPTFGQGVAVAWSGMRGLVTLATAFALPADFPQRDLVELTAFGVVLATLVLQGLTLAPLIRWLKLDRLEDPAADLAEARRALAEVARDRAEKDGGLGDMSLAELYRLKSLSPKPASVAARLREHRRLGLDMIAAQREVLLRLRDEHRIDMDAYYLLQEEVDWRELTLLPDEARRIDEI
jgi:monovalent cation/hydrogen antiporter